MVREQIIRTPSSGNRTNGRWSPPRLFWIFLLALGLRGVALLRFDAVAFDSAVYFEMADFIRSGHWSEALAFPYPPFYPILIAVLQQLTFSAEVAGLLITLMADLFILFPLVAVTRAAAQEEAARAAAFLWAVHPLAIRLGVQDLTDAPTLLFVGLALWAGLHALDRYCLRWAFCAGIWSGLAYLFRPEGIEPALVLAVVYLLHAQSSQKNDDDSAAPPPAPSRRGAGYKITVLRRIVWTAAPLVGWALIACPYVGFISVETGGFTISKKKSASALVRSLAPSGHSLPGPQDRNRTTPAAPGTTELPDTSWFFRAAENVYVFQQPLVNGLNPLVLILAPMGAYGLRLRNSHPKRHARRLLSGLLALHFAVLVALAANQGTSYLGKHHFFLMVLYILPFAGAGLASALNMARDRLAGFRRVPGYILALIVVFTIIWMVARGVDRGSSLRSAAAWIRTRVDGTPVIITNLAKLTYHAQAKRVDLSGTYDDLIRRGRDQSAHYVAFYPDLLPNVSPDFLRHLSTSGLLRVKIFPEPSASAPDQCLEIYRFPPE